ncbi:MAG: hypothetical protein ACLTK0_02050 [Anaerovoracaceae bacterium]
MWQVKIYEEKRCDGIFKDVFQVQEKRYVVFLLFCAIFAVSFYLYHLPLKAVAYPMLLCAVIGAVLLAPA